MNKFEETFEDIFESLTSIHIVNSDKDLDNSYIDSYSTKQQKMRDKEITRLLNLYVDGYQKKIGSNIIIKWLIIVLCLLILLSFSIVFIIIILGYDRKSGISSKDLAALISVCITFLTLIVGILKIITTYVFPKNEEEYITRIVESIQKNDLENKKENIRTVSSAHDKEKTSNAEMK